MNKAELIEQVRNEMKNRNVPETVGNEVLDNLAIELARGLREYTLGTRVCLVKRGEFPARRAGVWISLYPWSQRGMFIETAQLSGYACHHDPDDPDPKGWRDLEEPEWREISVTSYGATGPNHWGGWLDIPSVEVTRWKISEISEMQGVHPPGVGDVVKVFSGGRKILQFRW